MVNSVVNPNNFSLMRAFSMSATSFIFVFLLYIIAPMSSSGTNISAALALRICKKGSLSSYCSQEGELAQGGGAESQESWLPDIIPICAVCSSLTIGRSLLRKQSTISAGVSFAPPLLQ